MRCYPLYSKSGLEILFKNWIIPAAVYLISSSLYGQEINEVYDLDCVTEDDGANEILIVDDTIFILGNDYCTDKGVVILKTDLEGIPLDTLYFGLEGHTAQGSTLNVQGDSLLVTGWLDGDPEGADAFLAIYSTNFDSLFFQKYDSTVNVLIYHSLLTDDGGVILYGGISPTPTSGPHSLYVMKLDNNFDKLWDITFTSTWTQWPSQMLQLGNEILLVSTRHPASGVDGKHVYLIKMDEFGDTTAKALYSDHNLIRPIVTVHDDKIYVVAMTADAPNPVHTWHLLNLKFIKLDSMMTVTNESITVGEFGLDATYSFVLSGSLVHNDRLLTYGFNYPNGVIMAFNLSGTYLWTEEVYHDSSGEDRVAMLAGYAENLIHGVGSYDSPIVGPSDRDHWLFSVDSLGCMVPGCNDYLYLDNKSIQAEFNLFPNPTCNRFIITSSENFNLMDAAFEFVDCTGKKLPSTIDQISQTSVDIGLVHPVPGIYWLRITNAQGFSQHLRVEVH